MKLFRRRRSQPPKQSTEVSPPTAESAAPAYIDWPVNVCHELELTGSVGKGGKNRTADVELIQEALNEIAPTWGGPEAKLSVTGKCDSQTTKAIKRIQQWHFGKGDGRIDPKKGTHRKIVQILDGFVDIFIAQQPSDATDEASASINKYWISEMQTISVKDMVDQIARALRSDPGKKIKYMVIIGHGAPGLQRVGPGPRDGKHHLVLQEQVDFTAPAKGQEQKLAGGAETELRRLSGGFHPNAVITLGGCTVAGTSNESWGVVDGKNLLKGVSKALGNVYVQAGDTFQYDKQSGIEGTCIRARGDSCWVVTGTGFWGPGDDAEFSAAD
jgi:hypothetical protein